MANSELIADRGATRRPTATKAAYRATEFMAPRCPHAVKTAAAVLKDGGDATPGPELRTPQSRPAGQ